MARLGTKRPIFVPKDIQPDLDGLSKAALMDMAWNLASLCNGDSCDDAEATADRLYEEAVIVAGYRGDRLQWKRNRKEKLWQS